MTLLFALFVVLFASSYHDKKTIQQVSSAVKNGFQEMGTFVGSDSVQDRPSSNMSKLGSVLTPKDNGGANVGATPGNAGIDIVELQRKLTKALGKEIEHKEVELRMTPEGFVISLHELGFFDSGSGRQDQADRIGVDGVRPGYEGGRALGQCADPQCNIQLQLGSVDSPCDGGCHDAD
jgi:chemotaxis protein MotB